MRLPHRGGSRGRLRLRRPVCFSQHDRHVWQRHPGGPGLRASGDRLRRGRPARPCPPRQGGVHHQGARPVRTRRCDPPPRRRSLAANRHGCGRPRPRRVPRLDGSLRQILARIPGIGRSPILTMKNRRSGILPLGCFLQAAGRRFYNDTFFAGPPSDRNDSGAAQISSASEYTLVTCEINVNIRKTTSRTTRR